MKESRSNGAQILSDSARVWVNAKTGEALARLSCFGEQALIDIHRPLGQQQAAGECLDCRHDLQGDEAWRHFVLSLARHFSIEVGEKHRPRWAKQRAERTPLP